MPDPLWTTSAPNLRPIDAANLFAAEAFPVDGRKVESVNGAWNDFESFCGTFKLVGGVRTYRLEYVPSAKLWSVSHA